MSNAAQNVSKYFLGNNVPWTFRLLVLLLFLSIGGGLYLDSLSSKVSFPDFHDSREEKVDSDTGQIIIIEKDGLSTDDRKLMVAWARDKSKRLNESAKLLYDFAKIILGALLASLTQLISGGIKREYGDIDKTTKDEKPNNSI